MKPSLEQLIKEQKTLQSKLRVVEANILALESSKKSEEDRKKQEWHKKVIKYLNGTHELGTRLSFMLDRLKGFKTPESPIIESVVFTFIDSESMCGELYANLRPPYDIFLNMWEIHSDSWQEWGKGFQIPDVVTLDRMLKHITELAGSENEAALTKTLETLGFQFN